MEAPLWRWKANTMGNGVIPERIAQRCGVINATQEEAQQAVKRGKIFTRQAKKPKAKRLNFGIGEFSMTNEQLKQALDVCSEHEACERCPAREYCGDLSVVTGEALNVITVKRSRNRASSQQYGERHNIRDTHLCKMPQTSVWWAIGSSFGKAGGNTAKKL